MDESEVRSRLESVDDPYLGDDIVSLGLVNDIDITDDTIHISLAFGAPYSPSETEMGQEVREALGDIDMELDLSTRVDDGSYSDLLPKVENVIAVASGKGGVGKSTVATNLAVGLSELGASVGLFDADVYGPNVPQMLDTEETPDVSTQETLVPPEKYGIRLMSMELLMGDDTPVIWRGPMIHQVLTELWEDVEWGHLDYMVIDLPPGTGDTQLTLLQSVPITGAVVVTTPQDVALDDARKGIEMFGQHETPVLGLIENMSTFVCDDCGSRHEIFDTGGGQEVADQYDLPLLGQVPLDPDIRAGAGEGGPIALEQDTPAGEVFQTISKRVADNAGIMRRRFHIMDETPYEKSEEPPAEQAPAPEEI